MAHIVKIESLGKKHVYDISVDEYHNFIANGVVVHNCMQIAQKLAAFTPVESNKLRKVLIKEKNPEVLEKMHKKFLEGSKKRIEAGEITEKEVEEIFQLLKSFSKYGFNKSMADGTKVLTDNGLQEIQNIKVGTKVVCFDGEKFIETEVVALHDHGYLEGFEITFDDYSKVTCSINHKFQTAEGMQPLHYILKNNSEMLSHDRMIRNFEGVNGSQAKDNLATLKILSVRDVGEQHMYDLEVRHESHSFLLANGVISSNSHAMVYSAVTAVEFWLKYYFPTEYFCSLLKNVGPNDKKMFTENVMVSYLKYFHKKGGKILNPDINGSDQFDVVGEKTIQYGMDHVKMVAKSAVKIKELAPFTSIEDFYNRINRTKVNKRVVKNLISAGSMDKLGRDLCIANMVHDVVNKGDKRSEEEIKNSIDITKLNVNNFRHAAEIEYFRLRKEKKAVMPVLKTLDETWQDEISVLGLTLSKPSLLITFHDIITKNKYTTIDDSRLKKEAKVFGQVEEIINKQSKAGNNMFLVKISDGVDDLMFFVFESAKNQFQKELRKGSIAAIPLKKFDNDGRSSSGNTNFFYNTRKESDIIRR